MIAVPHIPRRLRRDIQQAGVLLLTFHAVVAPGQRVAIVMGNVLVEFFVFVVVNFRLAASPQGLRLVDFFPTDNGFAVFLFPFFNLNRQRDMVGIAPLTIDEAECEKTDRAAIVAHIMTDLQDAAEVLPQNASWQFWRLHTARWYILTVK